MSTDGQPRVNISSRDVTRETARATVDKAKELIDVPQDVGGTIHHISGNSYWVHVDGDPPDNAVPLGSAIGYGFNPGDRVICRFHGGKGSAIIGRQSPSSAVGCTVTGGTTFTVTTGSSINLYSPGVTAPYWNSVSDTNNFNITGTSNGILMIPPGLGGIYSAHMKLVESAKGSVGISLLGSVSGGSVQQAALNTQENTTVSATFVLPFVDGEFVRATVYNISGGTVTGTPTLYFYRIGA